MGVSTYPDEPRPPVRREPVVSGAYVGWSMYITGPVFICPIRTGDVALNARVQIGNFDFEGIEFKVEPDGCVAGRQTILHYLMTYLR
ncbi:hypothetical protein V8C42DRAFT_25817 [Trichoderma barbatum]